MICVPLVSPILYAGAAHGTPRTLLTVQGRNLVPSLPGHNCEMAAVGSASRTRNAFLGADNPEFDGTLGSRDDRVLAGPRSPTEQALGLRARWVAHVVKQRQHRRTVGSNSGTMRTSQFGCRVGTLLALASGLSLLPLFSYVSSPTSGVSYNGRRSISTSPSTFAKRETHSIASTVDFTWRMQ
jgi:hypothetical protein